MGKLKSELKNGANTTAGAGPARSANLVVGVDAVNYATLAGNFIAANGGKTFLITRRGMRLPGDSGVIEYLATPRQWGAWLGYFLRKRIRAPLMGKRDYYTVPAEWPHLFDAEATVTADTLAGDAFLNGFDPDRRDRVLIPDDDLGFRVKRRDGQ